jgi:hypothetical protein
MLVSVRGATAGTTTQAPTTRECDSKTWWMEPAQRAAYPSLALMTLEPAECEPFTMFQVKSLCKLSCIRLPYHMNTPVSVVSFCRTKTCFGISPK